MDEIYLPPSEDKQQTFNNIHFSAALINTKIIYLSIWDPNHLQTAATNNIVFQFPHLKTYKIHLYARVYVLVWFNSIIFIFKITIFFLVRFPHKSYTQNMLKKKYCCL